MLALAMVLWAIYGFLSPAKAEGRHAIAMHGLPKLGADFAHFPYVNPNAPKGGVLTLGETGTFDNLNPFIIKGVAPTGIRGYIYESLLARSADEPFTLYGLVAERLELPEDRSSITFHLNRKARFADGQALTAADVAFSLDLLRRKGRPYMRSHYGKVAKVEVLDAHTIRFEFNAAGDREIPLIMGLMPILPKHAIDEETFDRTTLAPPLGSGPYKIAKVVPGHSVTFTRRADYWGRDLPSRSGLFNFDEIRLNFFRNSSALFEAFKSGNVDYRSEADPARWIDSYD
ncbi:MAG: extracellular solute-binding protein, partial [Hyphomicrobiaceae bacterium]